MNCPVCNRNNAVTLSVCPSCGAMVSDSARLDANKVPAVAKPENVQAKINSTFSNKTDNSAVISNAAETNSGKLTTSSISTKLTSPTLVEFHTASAALPEWRLQLQNTVRQRHDRTQNVPEKPLGLTNRQSNLVTKGATALKIEPVIEITEPETAQNGNPKLASALERIKNSRQKFLVEEETIEVAPDPLPAKVSKNYPFYIASKTNEADVQATVNETVKPKLATSLRTETKDLDTNKLPPLPVAAQIATSFENNPVVSVPDETKVEEAKVEQKELIAAASVATEEIVQTEEELQVEENDDCAPFSMRFNAGLFDLIIGSFLSLIMLAPFILMSEGWSSFAGISAFLATCAVVMFVYMTTTISMYGKTFGMRLFSLELIDVEGEEYPTVHQAAVSSAVYLLSLAFGGIGFLTLPFNEEKRAVHDLVSGTVIVKEF